MRGECHFKNLIKDILRAYKILRRGDSIVTRTRIIDREALIVKYRPRAMIPKFYDSWRAKHLRDELFSPRREAENDGK
jgi:hypothetical protein